mgnify:CR=1 FL=1
MPLTIVTVVLLVSHTIGLYAIIIQLSFFCSRAGNKVFTHLITRRLQIEQIPDRQHHIRHSMGLIDALS